MNTNLNPSQPSSGNFPVEIQGGAAKILRTDCTGFRAVQSLISLVLLEGTNEEAVHLSMHCISQWDSRGVWPRTDEPTVELGHTALERVWIDAAPEGRAYQQQVAI